MNSGSLWVGYCTDDHGHKNFRGGGIAGMLRVLAEKSKKRPAGAPVCAWCQSSSPWHIDSCTVTTDIFQGTRKSGHVVHRQDRTRTQNIMSKTTRVRCRNRHAKRVLVLDPEFSGQKQESRRDIDVFTTLYPSKSLTWEKNNENSLKLIHQSLSGHSVDS